MLLTLLLFLPSIGEGGTICGDVLSEGSTMVPEVTVYIMEIAYNEKKTIKEIAQTTQRESTRSHRLGLEEKGN